MERAASTAHIDRDTLDYYWMEPHQKDGKRGLLMVTKNIQKARMNGTGKSTRYS